MSELNNRLGRIKGEVSGLGNMCGEKERQPIGDIPGGSIKRKYAGELNSRIWILRVTQIEKYYVSRSNKGNEPCETNKERLF